MFNGIASTSLHGWIWGAAALLGTPVGVRLRHLLSGDQRRRRGPRTFEAEPVQVRFTQD